MTRPGDFQQKKRTCHIVDFAFLADYRVKIKESEKRDKYLDLARELKNLWKVMVISVVIGALGTIPKGLIKRLEDLEIRGQVETIQTTALLRSDRILRRVLERLAFTIHSSKKPSANTGVKNS